MAQFSAGQSVATARILLQVVKHVLHSVMEESEQAVTQITDSLNSMSELSESQRQRLSVALEDFYHGTQGEGFKTELNKHATQIMEAAAKGNYEEVDKIGDSEHYKKQKEKTKALHDNLQDLIESSEEFSEAIFPLLISLQFQDKMKQELMGVTKALELFLEKDTIVVEEDLDFDEFWEAVQKGFNVVETRNSVLNIVKEALSGSAA